MDKAVMDSIVKGVVNGLKHVKLDLLNGMIERAPVKTGFMRANINITSEDDKGYTITSSAPYSTSVEEGHGGTPERPLTTWQAKELRGSNDQTTMPFMATTIIQNRDKISRAIAYGIAGEFK
jgi:hypothetical protein